jgi:chromosomal replication initiation ATPase DnaA
MVITEAFNVSIEDLKGNSDGEKLVGPAIGMYLMRQHTE